MDIPFIKISALLSEASLQNIMGCVNVNFSYEKSIFLSFNRFYD